MEEDKRISLREEVEKEARKIEQEISDNPDLKDMKVSEKMERELFLRIKKYEKKRAERQNTESITPEISKELASDFTEGTSYSAEKFLSEEDRRALLLGRELINKEKGGEHLCEVNKEYHKHLNKNEKSNGKKAKVFYMPRKKRIIAALVAVLVLLVGTNMTSIGSKSYLKGLFDGLLGNQSRKVLNVKDMEKQPTEDGEEITAFTQITEKLGVVSVRFGYQPENMKLENFNIDEEQKSAQLFYKYNGQVIRYTIYLNDSESSLGQKQEDILKDRFNIDTKRQTIEAEEYEIQEPAVNRFIANFSYKGVNYQLKGIFSKEEFTKIIKKLIYLE
ncbi:MAG: DUF4367 domain-containing protein [Ruminococcus sp.]|nr:DUF4367 domain-containing protein [Ruminococcus sp.]